MLPMQSSRVEAEDKCEVCGNQVKVQIFRGSHLCSDLCRKVKSGELTKEQADEQRTTHS
jgi:predicted nucleic acid-binding Zn ribbon protein